MIVNYNVLNYPQNDIDRFWSKVNIEYNVDGTVNFNECMIWNGFTDRNGYGSLGMNYKDKYQTIRAHRFVYGML